MRQFDYGRALLAALAWAFISFYGLQHIETIVIGLFWPLSFFLPDSIWWVVEWAFVLCIGLALWGVCVIWYFRNAPRGLAHGMMLGFSFYAAEVIDMFFRGWRSLPDGEMWWAMGMIGMTGLFGMVFKRWGTPFDMKGEKPPKVILVPD